MWQKLARRYPKRSVSRAAFHGKHTGKCGIVADLWCPGEARHARMMVPTDGGREGASPVTAYDDLIAELRNRPVTLDASFVAWRARELTAGGVPVTLITAQELALILDALSELIRWETL